jgi:hypothetical protein
MLRQAGRVWMLLSENQDILASHATVKASCRESAASRLPPVINASDRNVVTLERGQVRDAAIIYS